MSLPELRGVGRLLTDPRTGTTKTGTPWCSTLVKFASWKKTDNGWEEQPDSPVASVITFDNNAPLLAGYAKGDEIGIHGTVKAAVWKDNPQLAVTATQVWTPEKTGRTAVTAGRPGVTPVGADNGMTLTDAQQSASASLRRLDQRLHAANRRTA